MSVRRQQLVWLLLALFAFQHAEGFLKQLISFNDDSAPEESDEHYTFKFPKVKLFKPFSLFDKKLHKMEKKAEKFDAKIEKEVEKFEAKKEKLDEKIKEFFMDKEKAKEVFDIYKGHKKDDKCLEEAKKKCEGLPIPIPIKKPKYEYAPAPIPAPPVVLPVYKKKPKPKPLYYASEEVIPIPAKPVYPIKKPPVKYSAETEEEEDVSYGYKYKPEKPKPMYPPPPPDCPELEPEPDPCDEYKYGSVPGRRLYQDPYGPANVYDTYRVQYFT